MTKELLTIEFRYHDKPKNDAFGETVNKTITIGIYDTLDDAIKAGNDALSVLSKHFEVRSDDKFVHNHLFGSPLRLVTNCCYRTKGISFFAKITKLNFDNLNETISETFEAFERYRKYKKSMLD